MENVLITSHIPFMKFPKGPLDQPSYGKSETERHAPLKKMTIALKNLHSHTLRIHADKTHKLRGF